MIQTAFRGRIPDPRGLRMLAAATMAALAVSACSGGGSGPVVSGGGGGESHSGRTVLYAVAAAKAKTAAAATAVDRRQTEGLLRSWFVKGARQNLDYLATHQASATPYGTSSAGTAQLPAMLFTDPASEGPILYWVQFVDGGSRSVTLNTTSGDDTWNQASATHGSATYPADNGATVSLSTAELSATSKDGTRIAQATVFTDYDVNADDTDETDTAIYGEDVLSARATGDDTDYMAAGVWVSGPFSQANSDASAYAGAFAMGKVPYTGLNSGHNSLTSASYKGLAGGKRFSGGTVTDFTTTVSLTANFSSTATISGTVADVGGGQSLALSSASIARATDGGPFSGNTQLKNGATNVAGFTGKWGGAFYGATDTSNGPRGTAGTFGASGTGDTILGAFIAHRQ